MNEGESFRRISANCLFVITIEFIPRSFNTNIFSSKHNKICGTSSRKCHISFSPGWPPRLSSAECMFAWSGTIFPAIRCSYCIDISLHVGHLGDGFETLQKIVVDFLPRLYHPSNAEFLFEKCPLLFLLKGRLLLAPQCLTMGCMEVVFATRYRWCATTPMGFKGDIGWYLILCQCHPTWRRWRNLLVRRQIWEWRPHPGSSVSV